MALLVMRCLKKQVNASWQEKYGYRTLEVNMKHLILAAIILLWVQWAQADLAGDLRQLRNTISETAKTGKELSSLTGSGEVPEQNTVKSNASASGINEGDILVGKIGNIKLFKEPSKKAESAGNLTKSDEMIYTGTEANGFYSVATANKGDGWVEKMLVKKR